MSKKIVRLEVGSLEGEGVEGAGGHYDKPVMMVYTGKFSSLDGEVEIKDEDINKLIDNHNSFMSKLSRMATGEIPLKHSPPLQLDHSTSARDTVGRLVGPLKLGEHTTEDGTKHKAIMGTCRFLGADNIERVKDGRWAHVSIGADLEAHKLTELSITPFPAAADASLLRRMASEAKKAEYKGCLYTVYCDESGRYNWEAVRQSGIGENEADAVKLAKEAIDEFVEKNPKFSKGDDDMGYKEMREKMAMYEKCRKHLMDEKKMSEEDADKHLESAKDDELTAMAAEQDDKDKKMAAEEEEKKKQLESEKAAEEKHMSALKEHKAKFVALSQGMKATGLKMSQAEKVSKISVRLSKLKAQAKISPAEIKGIDLAKLAEKSDEVVEATLSSYEKREHIVDTGLYGSTKGVNPSQLAKRLKVMNMEREELQTRLNMPMKRAEALKRLNELDKEEKAMAGMPPNHAEPDGDEQARFEAMYGEMKRMESEGKHDEAKEHLRKYMTSVHAKAGSGVSDANPAMAAGDVVSDPTPAMSALAQDFKKMQTEFDEFVKLAAPAFGATTEELK